MIHQPVPVESSYQDLDPSNYLLQDIFQVDYVLVDQKTSIVDNNRGKDYHLPLANALTEKQILQRNAELLAELEQARHKVGSACLNFAVCQSTSIPYEHSADHLCRSTVR